MFYRNGATVISLPDAVWSDPNLFVETCHELHCRGLDITATYVAPAVRTMTMLLWTMAIRNMFGLGQTVPYTLFDVSYIHGYIKLRRP